MQQCDVAIIGGGLAGLTAGFVLENAGVDARVLEASSRLGGRIDAVRDQATGVAVGDLGPTWVWPLYQPSVQEWIERLGVETFAQYDDGHALVDLSPSAPPTRQFLPGQHGMARIVGGPSALVDALARAITDKHVFLNCPIARVERSHGAFQVHSANGSTLKAQKVIAAAPLRLMAERIDWPGLLDARTLSTMRNAPTWMATQAKVVVRYDTPFWRADGLSGRVASRPGPLAEVHDHSARDGSTAALFGFIGWPHDVRRTQDMRASITQQLVRCFGKRAADLTRLEICDWVTRPNICATIDRTTPAAHPQRLGNAMRQGHGDGGLFFAVAETANDSPGLIDGAFESGRRAAQQVLHSPG